MSPPCMCSHNFIPWEEESFSWPVSTHRWIFIHFNKARVRARTGMPVMSVSGWMMKHLAELSWMLRREEWQFNNAFLVYSFCFFNDPPFFGLRHHLRAVDGTPVCSDPNMCACCCSASIMVFLHYSLQISVHNGTGPSLTLLCYRIVKQQPFSLTNQANQGAVKEIY